ncbi:ABC transporter ATP-binding protein [Reinekea marina]|uniref:Energy-coupling factor ABC transporter ATP-binding protein n=1 Tax=Reinekea marina TaxID=1310421 RepID=A0ABV7WW01_9GAMM|nr:ABC transporter ATP-binding protein [Reinekea marina]MDN3648988.1 ABC transporter ATP-binding protein [Reinekea marina]
MNQTKISLKNVTLTRGGQTILKNMSLAITEQRVGIIGYNGSGKSTLLRLLCGLLAPDSGTIRVHNQTVHEHQKDLFKTAGLIFQNPDHQLIFPTVIEELCFGLRNIGYAKAEAISKAEQLLVQYERSHWRDFPVASLSEGQKQLLCILSILLMEPSVLLFDEPYSALDYPTRLQLAQVIQALPQQAIMVSHEPNSFADFDRIIWIDHGQVRMDGSPETILPAYERAAQDRNTL